MANALKGEVEVKAGDETLILVLDINGLIEVEEQVGLDLEAILQGLTSISLKVDRALIWAAMQKHHAPCNLLRAGEIVQQLGFKGAHAMVIKLMAAAMPEVVREKKEARPPKATTRAKHGTGNDS